MFLIWIMGLLYPYIFRTVDAKVLGLLQTWNMP